MGYTIETRPSESCPLLHITVRSAIHTVDAKHLGSSLHSQSEDTHYGKRLSA